MVRVIDTTLFHIKEKWRTASVVLESGRFLNREYTLLLDGRDIGKLTFSRYGGWGVAGVDLASSYQGYGLGKFLYKTSINDMIRRRNVPIYSGPGGHRSQAADRVWESLRRSNPEAISKEGAGEFDFYMVTAPLKRRPVGRVRIRDYTRSI